MNSYMKKLLIILQIGGGFSGLIFFFKLVSSSDINILLIILTLFFGGMYGIGIYAAILLIDDKKQGVLLSKIFQAFQIPVISTDIVIYKLMSGFGLTIGYSSRSIFYEAKFGSEFMFYLFNDVTLAIGVNIVSFGLFLYLMKLK